MYKSDLNIKHSNRSHLYWGIDTATGEVVGIDDVRSRGLNCNCKCAACNGDFIARKGDKNKHHFAHQSNYECVYANEIALYLYVKKLLEKYNEIDLPEVPVQIGNRTELAKDKWSATVGNVYYQCEPEQYPPLFLAELDGQPTRIVLAFEKYYTTEDYLLLKREAKAQGWECLTVPLPRISGKKSVNPELIHNSIKGNAQEKAWIYSSRADRWEQRLEAVAVIPAQPFPSSWGIAYECPIHCQEREGKYYARLVDCEGCAFNLAKTPNIKCLALNGIHHLKDFKISPEERMANIERIQKENDDRRALIAQERERREKLNNFKRLNWHYSSQRPQPQAQAPVISFEEKIRLGKLEVARRMENPSDDPVFDQFNRRWIKCTCCQEIKTSDEMATYGGRHMANMGVCRECIRSRAK